jgi:arabinogalactan oligomer/maltooligosaccharide transport system substrate-binding protein
MKRGEMMQISASKLGAGLTAAAFLSGIVAYGGSASAHSQPHGTVVVWSYLTTPEIQVLQREANQWARETGNHAQVIQSTSSFQDYATAAHSGKGPDMVFGIPDDNLGTFWAAGLLAKVPNGEITYSQYDKVALNATRFHGVQYAVPIDLETYALFYNKAMVKTPPTTFAQLFQMAKAFDEKSPYSGFEYDINNFYYSYAFLSGFGGYVFGGANGNLNPNNIGLDNRGAVEGLKFIRSFITQGFMPPDVNGTIADANFAHGKLAMLIDGPWDISAYEKAGVKFGIVPLPLLPNGHHPGSFFGTQAAFVSSVVPGSQQELAWSLLKYLIGHSAMALLQAGNRIPALAKDQPAALKADPYLAPFIEQSQWAQPMPNIPQMQAVWTPAADTLTLVTKGAESPAAAAKNMVEAIRTDIQQMQG